MTGMRIGEATAIQWEDIDFETGLLSISKTLYYKNINEYKFVEPKTKVSLRYIALDDDSLELLKQWNDVQQKIVATSFVMRYNGNPTQKHTLPYHMLLHNMQKWLVFIGLNFMPYDTFSCVTFNQYG